MGFHPGVAVLCYMTSFARKADKGNLRIKNYFKSTQSGQTRGHTFIRTGRKGGNPFNTLITTTTKEWIS